jgi:putative flippase GtrA
MKFKLLTMGRTRISKTRGFLKPVIPVITIRWPRGARTCTIERLLKNKTNNTLIQLFRYTFVGGFAFIFDFGSLFILTEYFNIYYLVSAAIAFLLGLTINYCLSVTWVFEKRSTKSKQIEFVIFALIGIIGLVLNEFFIWFFTEMVNIHYLFSKLISTALVYLWNFFIRKFTLFR